MFIMLQNCAPGTIGGTLYISHKIMARKLFSHFLLLLKPPVDGASFYARRFPKPSIIC